MADDDTCALCGGELVEEDIDGDRQQKMRAHDPDLEAEELHQVVCQACGHVAYRRS